VRAHYANFMEVPDEALNYDLVQQAIRNALSHSYRSSKQFKSKRRLQQIAEATKQQHHFGLVTEECTLWASTMRLSQSPRCITPSETSISSQESPSRSNILPMEVEPIQEDAFSILMATFGNNQYENPFEPRPLAPIIDDIFEPLPLAL
jgi:hypothetical protein